MPPIQLESYYGCLESVQGNADREGTKRMLAALGELKLISDHPKLYDSQRGGRPAFFCYLAYNIPHTPFQVPHRFVRFSSCQQRVLKPSQ